MRRHVLWGCLVAVLASACIEGYPTQEEGLKLHFKMTQDEAMAALNAIGSLGLLSHEWRYRLTDGCRLEVSVHGWVFRKSTHTVALVGSEVSMGKPGDSELYTVSLAPQGAQDEPTPVLAGAPWSQATQVKWLLDYLPTFCEPPQALGAVLVGALDEPLPLLSSS